MQLKIGDLVSGNQISTGRYLGEEKVQCEGQNSIFFKVYDSSQKIVHYLPEEQFKNIRKLPTKETVKRNMEILTQDSLIEVKEEEGSRYIFFTNKLKKGTFKGLIEVYHDLSLLKKENQISASERRLWKSIKDKIVKEVSYVMETDEDAASKLIRV